MFDAGHTGRSFTQCRLSELTITAQGKHTSSHDEIVVSRCLVSITNPSSAIQLWRRKCNNFAKVMVLAVSTCNLCIANQVGHAVNALLTQGQIFLLRCYVMYLLSPKSTLVT